MRAAVLEQFGAPLVVRDLPEPDPDGGVLVRVVSVGVCHTDLLLAEGRWPDVGLPLVLGHEVSGETADSGPVLVYGSWGCRGCPQCRSGNEQLCPSVREAGWSADGGYAEMVRVPSGDYLFPLGEIDPVAAAPLADAGITSYRAVTRARPFIDKGDRAVVIGCGGLGQFAIQYLKLLTEAQVIAVDRSPSKRARSLSLGADHVAALDELDELATVVLDFVGTDETLAVAVSHVARRGAVFLVGEGGGAVPFAIGRVPQEVAFTTSIWGSRSDMAEVVALAGSGQLAWNVESMPLVDVNEAHQRLRAGDVDGRLVLVP